MAIRLDNLRLRSAPRFRESCLRRNRHYESFHRRATAVSAAALAAAQRASRNQRQRSLSINRQGFSLAPARLAPSMRSGFGPAISIAQ